MKDISKKENVYKMVGFVNISGIIPDFVYPIFKSSENTQKYYIQEALGEEIIITNFREINNSWINKIILFGNGISTNEFSANEISINSEPIFGFQDSKEHVQIGRSKEIKEYLNNFKTCDFYLEQEIKEFLKMINA